MERLGRGFTWFDAGTHESLLAAGSFVHAIQVRQSILIACLEEIALRQGWISGEDVLRAAATMRKSDYGEYLAEIVREEF